MLDKIIRQKIGELLLTVDIQVIEVIEILVFIQLCHRDIPLKVEVVKAVFLNDLADRIAARESRKGSSHNDMRKPCKDDIIELFILAEL